MCSNFEEESENFKAVGALQQDDVDQRSGARASTESDYQAKTIEQEVPSKKRKTRRGRNKRRHPYLNRDRKSSNNVIKPEAPHNSNQFLIEDQGNSKEIDEQLKNDKVLTRHRDSSFSMDSDGEFYSSPEDEESFLRKDFDDTYENLRAERLNQMSKNELIEEFLQLEKRVDFLNKRKSKSGNNDMEADENNLNAGSEEFQKEIERLRLENENLKRENNDLRNKMVVSNSDSKDSESDSSETCSSCTSSDSESAREAATSPLSRPPSQPPINNTNSEDTTSNSTTNNTTSTTVTTTTTSTSTTTVDYTQTNGHSPSLQPM